jgi:hypothetical protein
MKFRNIKTKAGPLGTTAFCPVCKFGHSIRKGTGRPRPGFAANTSARKVVWDHIEKDHPELLK